MNDNDLTFIFTYSDDPTESTDYKSGFITFYFKNNRFKHSDIVFIFTPGGDTHDPSDSEIIFVFNPSTGPSSKIPQQAFDGAQSHFNIYRERNLSTQVNDGLKSTLTLNTSPIVRLPMQAYDGQSSTARVSIQVNFSPSAQLGSSTQNFTLTQPVVKTLKLTASDSTTSYARVAGACGVSLALSHGEQSTAAITKPPAQTIKFDAYTGTHAQTTLVATAALKTVACVGDVVSLALSQSPHVTLTASDGHVARINGLAVPESAALQSLAASGEYAHTTISIEPHLSALAHDGSEAVFEITDNPTSSIHFDFALGEKASASLSKDILVSTTAKDGYRASLNLLSRDAWRIETQGLMSFAAAARIAPSYGLKAKGLSGESVSIAHLSENDRFVGREGTCVSFSLSSEVTFPEHYFHGEHASTNLTLRPPVTLGQSVTDGTSSEFNLRTMVSANLPMIASFETTSHIRTFKTLYIDLNYNTCCPLNERSFDVDLRYGNDSNRYGANFELTTYPATPQATHYNMADNSNQTNFGAASMRLSVVRFMSFKFASGDESKLYKKPQAAIELLAHSGQSAKMTLTHHYNVDLTRGATLTLGNVVIETKKPYFTLDTFAHTASVGHAAHLTLSTAQGLRFVHQYAANEAKMILQRERFAFKATEGTRSDFPLRTQVHVEVAARLGTKSYFDFVRDKHYAAMGSTMTFSIDTEYDVAITDPDLCLTNQYVATLSDGSPDLNNTFDVAVEALPFTHYIDAECF